MRGWMDTACESKAISGPLTHMNAQCTCPMPRPCLEQTASWPALPDTVMQAPLFPNCIVFGRVSFISLKPLTCGPRKLFFLAYWACYPLGWSFSIHLPPWSPHTPISNLDLDLELFSAWKALSPTVCLLRKATIGHNASCPGGALSAPLTGCPFLITPQETAGICVLFLVSSPLTHCHPHSPPDPSLHE